VVYSPDGALTVSASRDGTIQIWDTREHTAIGVPLTGHNGGVYSVAITPDGKHIISSGTNNTVRIWDAKTGSPVGAPLRVHTD
jgi:WD40 repeat protein